MNRPPRPGRAVRQPRDVGSGQVATDAAHTRPEEDPVDQDRHHPRRSRHQTRHRRRGVWAVGILLSLLLASLPLTQGAAAQAVPLSVDMRILVIAADGQETDYPAITSFLDQVGAPYDTLLAAQAPLTASMLSDVAGHGRYQGIVLTTGNLTYFDGAGWQSALSTEEWATLRSYQVAFGVRSVTSYTFPEAAYGLSYVGYQDTLGTTLPVRLTPAGAASFPYVNSANAVPVTGAWAYLGTIIDPSVTTPLVTATVNGQSYPIASVTKYPAGYENLAFTVANNPWLTHSQLFSYGWISWVTGGRFLGSQAPNLNIQIDDLFGYDDIWNPATLTSSLQSRNTSADITALVRWQNARRADPVTPGLLSEFAFNGENASLLGDALTRTVVSNRAQFGFINHTRTHFNLDCGACPNPTGVITTTRQQIQNEILSNRTTGTLLGLPMQTDTMVQPDISGINTPPNPVAQKAAGDAGIRYWIGDPSRPGQGNPTFNTGFATAGDPRVYVIPRHASNLFYSVSTPTEWVSMFNHFYAPGGILCGITTCFSAPLTYDQILDHEAGYLLRYLLSGDIDPMMYHTANIKAYDGTRSVMTDVLDRALSKYKALVKTPISSNRMKQVGVAMQDRAAYNASGVTATLRPCTSITLKVTKAAKVPLSGVSYQAANSTVRTVGGRTVSTISLQAGQTVTVPLPSC
jgi:hypothetical protein